MYIYYVKTQQYQYLGKTTTCFDPICGPSSGCSRELVGGLLKGVWWLSGGRDLVYQIQDHILDVS
jgi:hypothetical protein